MTIKDAYNLTINKILELRDSGVDVTIEPSKSKNNKDTVKKYDRPDRLSSDDWVHVSFNIKSEEDTKKVREAADFVGSKGVRFDTGGGCGKRDWEMDWSFQYTGERNEDWKKARNDVDDMIDGFCNGGNIPETPE